MMNLTLALVAAAASVGSAHTIAPDHWMPFAALARAERWSARRTALVTGACGLGHVTVSAALGVGAALFGLDILESLGRRFEAVAGFLLIGFGVAYALWGIHRTVQARWHDHGDADAHPHWHHHHHAHGHRHAHAHDGRVTARTLFLLFAADPCVAVIPVVFAAAPLGALSIAAVIVAYEVATVGTMIALVLPARAAATAIGGAWADRYSTPLAGGVIAAVGLIVIGLGW